MRPSRPSLVVTALMLGQVVLSAPLGAQAGGALPLKAEISDGRTAIDPEGFDPSKVFINGVLVMTADGFKGLHRGLDTEIRLLNEFAAQLNTYRSAEDYLTCTNNVAMTPEAQQIVMRMSSLPENATAEQTRGAMNKMAEDMQALTRKKCGADVKEDWPQNKRDARLKEIVVAAAAATGPVSDATPRRGGPAPEDEVLSSVDEPKAMTDLEYKIWQERVEAYCAFKKLKPHRVFWTPGDGYHIAFMASALNPKAGKATWKFTPEEVIQADAECKEVVLKIGKIQQIIEMPPINIRGRRK